MFTEKKPGAPRVALVGCSASKLKRAAPARELYTSALFRAAYGYAEKACNGVLIVSAFYGVVAPKALIRPYDRSLRRYNKSEREDWGVRTVGHVLPSFALPPLLIILAGQVYADALVHGAHWHNLPRPELPLSGIRGCGPRVKWLRVERVRAKLAQVQVENRCHAECPTWFISDTARGLEIHRCDACWHGVPDPLTDDEAALLPEAQANLTALETESLALGRQGEGAPVRMTFSLLTEVEASGLFAGENINWQYCKGHATFVHRDGDACEFILHIGDGPGSENCADDIITQMKEYGCTPAFIDAYTEARGAGALRVLFHA